MKETQKTLGNVIQDILENNIPLSDVLESASKFDEIIKYKNLDPRSVIEGMDFIISAMNECNDGEKYIFSELVSTLNFAMINSVIAKNYIQGKYDKYLRKNTK